MTRLFTITPAQREERKQRERERERAPMEIDANGIGCEDVHVVTSSGKRIPAHSSLLAAASPVLERIAELEKQRQNAKSRIRIKISGVPYEAAVAFVRSLQSRSMIDEDVKKHGMHLLVLSHVYQVSWLKRKSEMTLATLLTIEKVIDILQLSRLCDAQWLYLRCLRLLVKNFAKVENTEAWRFLQENDPLLELEILQFLDEIDMKRKRQRRRRAEQQVYFELNEVMECLDHICEEGCTEVGPMDRAPAQSPCEKFETCRGIQLLIRHFASCHSKSCSRCRRLAQLLWLHSALCDKTSTCKVPLCMQYKMRTEKMQEKLEENKWGLLVRKMKVVKVMSVLIKKKREEKIPSISN